MNPATHRVELAEWQSVLLPGVRLSDADRRVVESLSQAGNGRLNIEELRQGLQIRAYSWVGVIRLQDIEIRVWPKLAGGHTGLVEMLTLTSGLNALRRNRGQRYLETADSVHLLDLIALLFAQACQRLVDEGLLYDYVEREATLPVLRGRLLVGQQVRQFYGRVDRLACRYDDHLTDIVENQIVAAVLLACRFRVSHPAVSLQIHRLHTLFAAACSPAKLPDFNSVRRNLSYHRLNEHYREAHELAWLLLASMGIDDLLAVGQTRSFVFLLDMNQLFERFVERFVTHALSRSAYQIQVQQRDRAIIWDVAAQRPYTHIVPDLLIQAERNGRRLALDAKYKLYDERRLSTADIYQSFFYAYAYNDVGQEKPAALLLYPASRTGQQPVSLRVRDRNRVGKGSLYALPVSIPQAIEEINGDQFGPLSQLVFEAVTSHLADGEG